MSESRPEPKEFSIPDLDLQPFESSVTAQRYIATIRRKKGVKRVAITERTAQLIARLQQGWSLDQVADWLSEQYGFAIVRENVSAIIEEELVPRGLAYPSHGSPAGSNVQIRKKSLGARLLQGTFRRRLLIEQRVRAVCAPLADLYSGYCLLFAVVLIFATRWVLYTDIDTFYFKQSVLVLSPGEYLASLVIVMAVVLIHEFGHAAAQIRMGLNPGPIGIQLYSYLPALYADVSESWKLRPMKRVVVDGGGIYFQCIAASLVYLLYRRTHYAPLLTASLTSDTLVLISINPFLKFDGYWLLADLLAVPNLRQLSGRVARYRAGILIGRRKPEMEVPLGLGRQVVLCLYVIARVLFFGFILRVVVIGFPGLLRFGSTAARYFGGEFSSSIRNKEWMAASSWGVRIALFSLLLLTLSSAALRAAVSIAGLLRRYIRLQRPAPSAAGHTAAQAGQEAS